MSHPTSSAPLKPQAAPQRPPGPDLRARCAGMVGVAYAAVPLYRAFCQATGYDGTVRKAEAAPDSGPDQTLTSASTPTSATCPGPSRPRKPARRSRSAPKLAFFQVTNHGDKAITGRATSTSCPKAPAPTSKSSRASASPSRPSAGRDRRFPGGLLRRPDYATDPDTREWRRSRSPTPSSRSRPAARRRRASRFTGPWRTAAGRAIGHATLVLRGPDGAPFRGLNATMATAPSNTTTTWSTPARGRWSDRSRPWC